MDTHRGWTKRGYIPHYDAADVTQHIVFRLADSLPPGLQNRLGSATPGEGFALADGVLDTGFGARALSDPRLAEMVETALLYFDGERYRLCAWCVMPTHVHVLATQIEGFAMERIVHGWKSFTAHRANTILNTTGPFWAADYYDRMIRESEDGVVGYIEHNPVKAGLCDRPTDWAWSSARRR